MRYPLKVIGDSAQPMQDIVGALLQRHIPDFDPTTLSCQPSSAGRYVSVRAEFVLHSKEQVDRLYADLAACPQIKLVL